jgi:hypothetical protein
MFIVSILRTELKKEVLSPSDSSVTIYQYTWYSIPQDFNLHVLNLHNAIYCSKVENKRSIRKSSVLPIILNLRFSNTVLSVRFSNTVLVS